MQQDDDDSLRDNFQIKSKEELRDEDYYAKVREWRSLPLLKCPVVGCQFRNVYQVSIDHHYRLTHQKGGE